MHLIRAIVVLLILSTGAFAAGPTKIKTIQAVVKTDPWAGWGGGEPLPEGLKREQPPQKFTRVPPTADGTQTFSGKVIGLKPSQKAEVGIVSLKGTHWLRADNYEWKPLDATRTFTVTSARNPGARKTLAVRTDAGQWSYLRGEFDPGEGATDVALVVTPASKVVVTMEGPDGNPINFFRGEVFNAYMMSDDDGNELRAQRYGNPTSKNGAMVLELPAEPFGVLLSAEGVAPCYEVIDPREANQFHFKMIAAGKITGIVTRDGKPAANEAVFIVNDAAPLSATNRRTDAQGRFQSSNRVPGIQQIVIGDYQTDIELKPGETAELKIDLNAPAPDAK